MRRPLRAPLLQHQEVNRPGSGSSCTSGSSGETEVAPRSTQVSLEHWRERRRRLPWRPCSASVACLPDAKLKPTRPLMMLPPASANPVAYSGQCPTCPNAPQPFGGAGPAASPASASSGDVTAEQQVCAKWRRVQHVCLAAVPGLPLPHHCPASLSSPPAPLQGESGHGFLRCVFPALPRSGDSTCSRRTSPSGTQGSSNRGHERDWHGRRGGRGGPRGSRQVEDEPLLHLLSERERVLKHECQKRRQLQALVAELVHDKAQLQAQLERAHGEVSVTCAAGVGP